jgi:acetoin utilization deacetylase AcuC-like enzyme/ankyrin repeat protein
MSSTSSNQHKQEDSTITVQKNRTSPKVSLLANREADPPQAFSGGKNLNSLDITLNHVSAEGFKWNGSESISIAREDLTQNGHRIISKDVAIAVQIDSYNKREGDIKTEDVNPEILHIQNSSDTKEKNIKTKFSCPYDLDERDDDENTPLHVAIHARKIENVRVLLEAGATVHKKCDGSAPIHLAICLGAIPANAEFAEKCVYLLREYNADLTMRDDSFHTPLYLACVSNLCPVVELLLNDPLSKETLNFKADRTGGRALHAAAKCDAARRGAGGCVTKLLLAAENIEIDARNNYGRTPLHIAASRGNWHVARLLINAGADAHILDKCGLSPGSRARKRGMVIPNDLKILGNDAPTRDLIMDPDGVTLLLCHELCIQHRTCPPIVRDDADASEPPPENVRRLNVLINDEDGILRCGEFSACKWNTDARRAALSDVLKVHEYPYIERMSKLCSATPDHPRAIQTLDADTTVSHWSFEAALRAAGSVCEAVDRVVSGDFRNAFCAIRPPGHHAGPRGIVTCPNDPDGSHGFCLLNNIAIGAAYARSMYRNDGIKKIAIIDFDVHHGNGTEEIVRQLTPNIEHAIIRTPFAVGGIQTSTYKPWLDESDVNEVLFASTHGYGPRDSKVPLGGIPGGWFYPASGKTYKSKSLTDSHDLETPNLSDFLMSQTWARLGEDYRNNCCKIIDIGLSLPAKDDTYNHGLQRLELRDAYRNSIIPALMEFDPDLIFISAGFDAHRKDSMNFGYVGMIEEDYEWLTEQIVKVANSCCNGRVVSALEGGYKIHGGIISPFARSVASHVRALADGGNSREMYDMDEGEWESRFERHMNEEKEKKRQMKMDRHYRSAEGITPDNDFNLGDIGEIRNNDDEDQLVNSRKRSRKQVDYKQLFEQMKKEGN